MSGELLVGGFRRQGLNIKIMNNPDTWGGAATFPAIRNLQSALITGWKSFNDPLSRQSAQLDKGALDGNQGFAVDIVRVLHCAPLVQSDNCVTCCGNDDDQFKNQRKTLVAFQPEPPVFNATANRPNVHHWRLTISIMSMIMGQLFVGTSALVAGGGI